jgi:hypothetical protein
MSPGSARTSPSPENEKQRAGAALWRPRYHRCVSEADGKPLDERLEEIGAQLAWVRDYL